MKIPSFKNLRQSGSTLMTTLVILGIIGFLMITYLTLTQSQSQATMRSQAWNLSMAMVEAGLEEALAHLNVNGSNTLAKDGWSQSGTLYTKSRWLGENYYLVAITNYIPGSNNIPPTIISRGYVPLLAPLAAAGSPVMFADFTGGRDGSAYIGRGVRVTVGQDRIFSRGMVAKDTITLNGNNISTDSFDSSDPRYSTNGLYSPLFRRANGDVASNAGITNAINVGNANIRGHIATGPKGTISLGPNGTVGDLAWVAGGNTGIQPGYALNDMNMSFPEVKVPFTGGYFTPTKLNPPQSITTTNFTFSSNGTSVASISLPAAGYVSVATNTVYATDWPTNSPGPISTNKAGNKIKGYYYPVFTATYSGVVTNATVVASTAAYDYILDDGNYQIGTLDGSVYVRGKAVLYVTTSLNIDSLNILPGQSIDLYSSAPSVSLAGNNTLNSDGFAGSFRFWGLPSCTSVTFSGNAGFTGTIYAPEAAFNLNGGGNNVTDFIGASVTKSVNLNGHFNFHYDELLSRIGPTRGYYITSWSELDPGDVPLVKRW